MRYIFTCSGISQQTSFHSIVLAKDAEECITVLKHSKEAQLLVKDPIIYNINKERGAKLYLLTKTPKVLNVRIGEYQMTYSHKFFWTYLPMSQWCNKGILSQRAWKQVNRRLCANL